MYKNIMTLLLSIILLTGCNNGAQRSQTKTAAVDISWYNTTEDYFEISTAAQLAGLAYLVFIETDDFKGATLKLVKDIDLKNFGKNWNDGKGWIPIGDDEFCFNGKFDGNNKKITGLYINDPTLERAGLFGVSTGSITNLGIDVNITAGSLVSDDTPHSCGGVVGRLVGSCTNCYVTGMVSGNNNVGGVVGDMYYDWISSLACTNCYATCEVRGNRNVGGVTGSAAVGTCLNCYASGSVSGNSFVGGVSGFSFANRNHKYWAALNPSIMRSSGNSDYFSRVCRQEIPYSVAWTDMALFRGFNDYDGLSVTAEEVTSADFWLNNPDVWGKDNAWDTDIWDIADGRLPILKNVGGDQLANNPPAHLK